MSGIEVAGLVLGAFPIAMEALEKYRAAFAPLKSWWKFQRTFEDFIDDIGTQSALFDNNLEKLLNSFVDSDVQMGILLNDPVGPAWKESALDIRLQTRLGSSHPWFLRIVRRMNETMTDLLGLLGLKDGQPPLIGNRFQIELEFRRLRFSFSKKKFMQVDALAKYNTYLCQLIQDSTEIAPATHRRKSGPIAAFLTKIQNHASSLYTGTKLRLDKRLNGRSMEGDDLRVVFAVDQTSSQPSTQWQELHVKVSPVNSLEKHIKSVDNSSTSMHQLLSTLKADMAFESQSRISISSPASSQGSTTLLSITPVKQTKRVKFLCDDEHCQPSKNADLQDTDKPIHNICSTLRGGPFQEGCIGYLLDNNQRRHSFYSIENLSAINGYYQTVPLSSLIGGTGKSNSRLTRQRRLELALTLTCSLLQLHNTPWITDQWSKKDILFFSEDFPTYSPNLPNPCVSYDFHSKTSQVHQSVPQVPNSFSSQTAFSSLGILLLELCFNCAIEAHPSRNQFLGPDQRPNLFTDICTARVWQEELIGELGDDLADAVRRCLNCSFGPKPDLSSREFLEAVFEGVVLPLRGFLDLWGATE